MGKFIDYYTLLNVLPTANEELIKRAYRIQSKELHPDRGGNEQQFIQLTEAYEVLSSRTKRKAYDQDYAYHQQAKEQTKERPQGEREKSKPKDESQSQKNYPKFSFDYVRYGKVMLGALIGLSIMAKAISALDESSEPEIPVNPIVFPVVDSDQSDDITPDTGSNGDLQDEYEVSVVEASEHPTDFTAETEITEELLDEDEKEESVVEENAQSAPIITDSSSLYVRYLDRIYKLEGDLQSYEEVWEIGSDAEITQATYSQLEDWDDLLNEIYQALRMELTEEEFVNMRDSQRIWLVERDRIADTATVDFIGGSWEAPVYTLAQMEETRKRCLWLVMNYMN